MDGFYLMDTKTFDWKKYLVECFESTQFLALSSLGADGIWTCPLFFAFDEKYNLYFISQPKSRHMGYIANRNNVSLAIYSTQQDPAKDVFGIQMRGHAILVDDADVEDVFKIYYARSPAGAVMQDNLPEKYKGARAEWKFVKIVPTEIYYFDTRFFGEKRQVVPMDVYRPRIARV